MSMNRVKNTLVVFLLASCGHASEGPRATEPQPVSTDPALAGNMPSLYPPETPASEGPMTIAPEDDTFSDVTRAPQDVAAPPATATTTSSGLASRALRRGSGTAHPSATSRVTVHYAGWTTDGRLFDSSVQRGSPSSFPLNGVIAGWTEGVQLMVQGERRRFWIPANLAYGNRPGRPAGMLVFDVELLSIDSP